MIPIRRRAAPAVFALFVLFAIGAGRAAEAMPGVAELFDPAAARRPRAGEWLEYVIAFPVDPLENRLGTDPLPVPNSGGGSLARPEFVLPTVWRSLPLRLIVRQVEADGLRVRMNFNGSEQEILLPLSADKPEAAFHYDPPQPASEITTHRLDGFTYEVEITRRHADGHGFARMTGRDFPFGIVRFATENIDLILVGMGSGTPPAFPLPGSDQIEPPPGGFYSPIKN